jgi:hypothetical protein
MKQCTIKDMREMLEFTPIKEVYEAQDEITDNVLRSIGREASDGDGYKVPAHLALQTIETMVAAQVAALFSFAMACTGELEQTSKAVVDTLEGIVMGMATGIVEKAPELQAHMEAHMAMDDEAAEKTTAVILDMFKRGGKSE